MNQVRREIRILIVEDDEPARSLLANIFRRRGFCVAEAGNGQEGIDSVMKNNPEIIIIDGMMPVMDGFEAVKILKNNPQTKDIPIIFCSATHSESEARRKVEVEDYIEKPLIFDELYKKVCRFVSA